LLPILIPILVNKYYHVHYQQAAESRKRDLVHKLCNHANVFEYRNRLVKSGFNLRDDKYIVKPKISESPSLFVKKLLSRTKPVQSPLVYSDHHEERLTGNPRLT
jgi:hypothetical protein